MPIIHNYRLGQRVRRNPSMWPENNPSHYGTVSALLIGTDEHGRQQPAYRVAWDGAKSTASFDFLESELVRLHDPEPERKASTITKRKRKNN